MQLIEVGGVGDTLEFVISGKSAHIEVDNPWSGDTETGFGRSASFTLTKEQARELAAQLLKWAEA